MQALAHKALIALWTRADSADRRGSARRVTLPMSEASFPAYLTIATLEAKESFHAELREAVRAGAIEIEWDPRAGQHGQIRRLRLASLDALSTFLGTTKHADKFATATALLHPWLEQWPNLMRLVEAWRAGRAPRGVDVGRARDVKDALVLIDDCKRRGYQEVSERRASARLFGDSKRIEALVSVLDILTVPSSEEMEARRIEAVLAPLGLLRHPQPMLIAGQMAMVTGRDAEAGQPLEVPYPYVGLSPRHIFGAQGAPAYLLSVENLTVFHELATGQAERVTGAIVYLGGFPSPSMLRAYAAVTRSLPAATPILHWGDRDLGGFRIAETLAQTCQEAGRSLRLWQMAVSKKPDDAEPLTASQIKWIMAICERWDWRDEAAGVTAAACRVEQELQDLVLP